MDRYPSTVVSTGRESALTTNKVLRNTYLLLGATLAFSALMAGVSMALNLPHFGLFTLLPTSACCSPSQDAEQQLGHRVDVRADRLHRA